MDKGLDKDNIENSKPTIVQFFEKKIVQHNNALQSNY